MVCGSEMEARKAGCMVEVVQGTLSFARPEGTFLILNSLTPATLQGRSGVTGESAYLIILPKLCCAG
jgi:hypothetical protein